MSALGFCRLAVNYLAFGSDGFVSIRSDVTLKGFIVHLSQPILVKLGYQRKCAHPARSKMEQFIHVTCGVN
jgi:hypothetical protein